LESGTLCAYVCVCVCYMCVYMCICVCVCVWFVCFNRISDSLLSLCNSQPGTHQHLVRGPCMHTHIHTVHEHVRAHTHGLRACACPHTRFTSMCVPTHTVHEHAHAHTHGSRACACPHTRFTSMHTHIHTVHEHVGAHTRFHRSRDRSRPSFVQLTTKHASAV